MAHIWSKDGNIRPITMKGHIRASNRMLLTLDDDEMEKVQRMAEHDGISRQEAIRRIIKTHDPATEIIDPRYEHLVDELKQMVERAGG